MRILLLVSLLTASIGAAAQLSAERQAVNRMQKGKWKGAEESLRKALRKDTLNPEAKLLFSRFYFSQDNPARNIDSAYRYAIRAIVAFPATTPKEKDRLKRFPLDSAILIGHRKKIDSAAFELAKRTNTEKSYQDYLSRFIYANELPAAIELRNEVAFVDALKVNTYKSFLDYLNKYPSSTRAAESRYRYEKLLYEEKTRDGKLRSFEAFYKEYPESPYRKEADKNIFEITTASGRPASFVKFISNYPTSAFRSRVQVILYHLSKEEDANVTMVLTDSLKKVQRDEQGYWVPVLRNGKFGFMDQHGNETVSLQFENLLPEYLCGNIREDYLVGGEGVMSRSGEWIFKGQVKEVRDAGSGFLKIDLGNCINILHKSGFALPGPCYEDAKLIGHNFIAVKEQGRWGLISLACRILLAPQYEDIAAVDGLIILSKNSKKTIVTVDQIAALAEKFPLPMALVFDDVQRIASGNYLVRNGSLEGLLNEALEFIVPLDRQGITKVPFGFMLEKNRKYRLVGFSDKLSRTDYDQVQFYGNWIKLLGQNDLQLYDLKKKKVVNDLLDSLWFENKLAFAWKSDSLRVYLSSASFLDFIYGTKVNFIKSVDSTEYFFVPDKSNKSEKNRNSGKNKNPGKDNKTVFNAKSGARLFTYDFDEIEYIGNASFLVGKANKKGLLAANGKVILETEYTAIVPLGTGILSLLKDKKFGLYQIKTKKLLKPEYDRNLNPVSGRWLAAFKEGAYGLIGWDAKPQGKFEFEEIRPWNDSSVMVKKDFQWMIYSIRSDKVVRNKIMDYAFVSDTPVEKVAIVHQDLRYGVISNRRGEIIPANFSDVVNVGSDEEPLYFAEKNVEEAGIYVVIYYDRNGKFLRKQVYEESEYERIYCTGNN